MGSDLPNRGTERGLTVACWTEKNQLDLGALGWLTVFQWPGSSDHWTWVLRCELHNKFYATAARARRAAESWLRRALKQAERRCSRKV